MKDVSQDIANMRIDYTKGMLDEAMVDQNPMNQFRKWFNEAVTAQVTEPNIMILSTVSAENKPTSRVVLLKDIKDNGLTFYTNYQSHKAKDMAHNGHVSLLFMWTELQRQVRIEGMASKVSTQESVTYFDSRPIESRIGANISAQSAVIPNRQFLEDAYQKLHVEYMQGKKITRPENWGGYLIIPDMFEFWQGRANRLHDRISYTSTGEDHWQISRLSP